MRVKKIHVWTGEQKEGYNEREHLAGSMSECGLREGERGGERTTCARVTRCGQRKKDKRDTESDR